MVCCGEVGLIVPARLSVLTADMWLLFSAADVVRGWRLGVRDQLWVGTRLPR